MRNVEQGLAHAIDLAICAKALAARVHVRHPRKYAQIGWGSHGDSLAVARVIGGNVQLRIEDARGMNLVLRRRVGEDEADAGSIDGGLAIGRVMQLKQEVAALG